MYSLRKLANMQYSITDSSRHAVFYITVNAYNCKFVHFDHLHPIPPNSGSVNYVSDFFFYDFGLSVSTYIVTFLEGRGHHLEVA